MTLPSTITPDRKRQIESAIGARLDASLGPSISSAFGPSVGAAQVATLKTTCGQALRARLGITLGTRVDVSVGAAAVAAGGVTLKVSLGGRVQFSAAASASMGATLSANIGAALLGLGLSPSERQAVQSELEPALTDTLDRSLRSATGESPGFPHAQGARLLTGEVKQFASGPWRAYLAVDVEVGQDAPSGPYTFEVDGYEWRGTVVPGRSGEFGGRTGVYVVGGAGGLGVELPARNYAGGVTRVRTVVADIMRDSGEELSPDSDQSLLDKQLPGWQRSRGPAQEALPHLLNQYGASWRVLRDGKVWIGYDTWAEQEPTGVVLDDDLADGVIVHAPDAPDMVPGVTCRGRRIQQVVHRFDAKGLRTELHARSVSSSLTERIVEKARRGTEFAYRYRCKVVRQNSNGTVDVSVDDERMKGRGVGNCRVRVGIPGSTLTVPSGARCLVGWDDGDPSLPYVDSWESGTRLTTISVGSQPRAVARIGDMVQVLMPPLMPVNGTLNGLPFVGALTVITPAQGIIQSAGTALSVGSALGFVRKPVLYALALMALAILALFLR